MCGIVAYIGKKKKANFLIEKLQMLEYRGCDSSGIVNLENNEFQSFKEIGKVDELKRVVPTNFEISCAMAHTRWATHGVVSKTNAHPQFSKTNRYAMIHNGIFENYQEIQNLNKEQTLLNTDTAVVVQHVEELQIETIEDLVDFENKLTGSHSFLLMDKKNNNRIYFSNQKNSMFISKNDDGEILIASDLVCFVGFSNKIIEIESGNLGFVEDGKILIFNREKIEQKIKEIPLKLSNDLISKGSYAHYMEKEIFEEKEALKNLVKFYRDKKVLECFNKKFMSKFNKIIFVGCGTAFHSGMIGSYFARDILKVESYAEVSSEFNSKSFNFVDENVLCVFISQSGETADTLSAITVAKELGATCVGITNVMHSTMSRMVQFVLPVCAGIEISIASTKAYICQLASIYLLCHSLALESSLKMKPFYQDINLIAGKILNFDKEKIKLLAKKVATKRECVFLGKNIEFVSARESSLKLRETSCFYSTAYPSGELKHGYIATINKDSAVIAFACNDFLNNKTINALKEAESRGAEIIVLTNDSSLRFENQITIDENNIFMCQFLIGSIMEYFAYSVSLARNLNPDKPKNLAKSVTVE